MKNPDLASRPTLVQTTPPLTPGIVQEGLKLAGGVIISTAIGFGLLILLSLLLGLTAVIGYLLLTVVANVVNWF